MKFGMRRTSPCLQHRYSVVVQDLSPYWIQCHLTKSKIAQETMNSLQKFMPPDQKPGMIHTDNSLAFKVCVGIATSQPHGDQKPTELPRTQSAGPGRYLCTSVSVRSGRKVVERNNGMLLLFAKQQHKLALMIFFSACFQRAQQAC